MKRQALLLGSVLSLVSGLYGQGTVDFRNVQPNYVTNAHTGERLPVGTTFKAALYVAWDGVTDDSQYVLVGADASFPLIPGLFSGGGRTVAFYPPGSFVMLQVRVWETSYGNTYEAAAAASPMNGRTALIGKSVQMRRRLADPGAMPPEPPTRLDMPGFGVSYISVPSLSINDVVASEGTNGTKEVVFTVTLEPTAEDVVTVDYATADGTALAGSDFVGTNGTLTFIAGETSKTVTVIITADVPPEPDESFYVILGNAGQVPFVRSQGECIITEVRVTGISIDVAVSFNTVANRHYVLERSDDGLNWTTVTGAEDVTGNGTIMTAYDRGGGCQTQRLYRARLLQ